jgi:hypothetical protein
MMKWEASSTAMAAEMAASIGVVEDAFHSIFRRSKVMPTEEL